MNERERQFERNRLFRAGVRWLRYRRVRYWWKPWTWFGPAGVWENPR